MARLLRLWISPLRIFERGTWNVLLNLFGAFVLSGLAWGVARLTTSAVGIVAGVAFLLLVLLGLALIALWKVLPRQLLTLSFDERDVQVVKVTGPLGNVVGDARYFHFKVEAPTKVRNCRGRLVLVEQEQSGSFQRHPLFKPPEDLMLDSKPGLVWSEIEPDLPARINLVCTESTHPGIALLCVPDHTPHGNMTQLAPGRYRLTARVSADGVEDVDARFVVRVTNVWDGLQVELSD